MVGRRILQMMGACSGGLILWMAGCADQPSVSVGPQPIHHAVPLTTPKLSYPVAAARFGIEGEVVVDCTINTDGTTSDIVIKSWTNPIFTASAAEYVETARYRPATQAGEPVAERHHTIHVTYQLPSHPTLAVIPGLR